MIFILFRGSFVLFKKRRFFGKSGQHEKSAQYIFEELHSSLIGAHCGIQKTLDAISKHYLFVNDICVDLYTDQSGCVPNSWH